MEKIPYMTADVINFLRDVTGLMFVGYMNSGGQVLAGVTGPIGVPRLFGDYIVTVEVTEDSLNATRGAECQSFKRWQFEDLLKFITNS